jgi:hypothetical protein
VAGVRMDTAEMGALMGEAEVEESPPVREVTLAVGVVRPG